MKKKLVSALAICLMITSASAIMAESNMKLVSNINLVSTGTVWEDPNDAPRIKIEIKDAYLKKGKQEKFALVFEDCRWTEGNCNIQIKDCENIDSSKFATGYSNDNDGEVLIDIPNDIEEGKEISFTIPLMVRVTGEHPRVTIKPKNSESLIQESTVSIGTSGNSYLTYSVGDIPTIENTGMMADICFEEILGGNWDREFEWLTITLDQAQFDFDALDYKEKKVHDSDTDYIVEGNKYIEYTGAFSGNPELYIKEHNKDSSKVTLKIQPGEYAGSGNGKVIIKNLPIVAESGVKPGEAITASITGDKLLTEGRNVKIAYIQEAVEKVEEVEEVQEQERVRGIFFTVGEKSYSVDGEKIDMEAEAYISSKGNIMVPVRYLATALGVFEDEISFNSGSVYFLYGDRRIQLINGSNIAYVNQIPIPMGSVVESKEGRLYVPLGEVARILGIKRTWYPETKTVSFNEKK